MPLNSMPARSETTQADDEARAASLVPGTLRAETMQRLQIGIVGVAIMLLLMGLAQVIFDQVQQSEAGTVPQAAATVEPADVPQTQNDPLAEAGVVPDLPSEPILEPVQEAAIMPEQGNAGTP